MGGPWRRWSGSSSGPGRLSKVILPMLSALLPRLAGWGRAREIIYTGGSITAHDALSYGFVERVVPMEKLDEAVEG